MNLKRVIAKCPLGFVEEANSMGEKALNLALLDATNSIHETEEALEKDEAIERAKEKLKDLRDPYREVLVAQKAKIKYAEYRLEELGK